jgi:serine/threonine protein kinase
LALSGAGALVYKEYKKSIRESAGPALLPGLLAVVRFRVKLPEQQRVVFDERAIWPLAVVTGDAGEAVGIVMREIPGEFFGPKGPREAHVLFQADQDLPRLGYSPWDMQARMAILVRAAAVYAMFHRIDVIFGDLSPRNLVLTDSSKPRVMAIDTDSVRLKGTRAAFGSQLHTPAWEPPESQRAERMMKHARRSGQATAAQQQELNDAWVRQTTHTDVYKFGLMIVRVLDYGRYRSQNRNPERARQVLHAMVGRPAADLLTRTVGDDPKARPTMREWYYALQGRQPPVQQPDGRSPTRLAVPAPRPVKGWDFVPGTGWVRNGKP